jgi:hypothetical protein
MERKDYRVLVSELRKLEGCSFPKADSTIAEIYTISLSILYTIVIQVSSRASELRERRKLRLLEKEVLRN